MVPHTHGEGLLAVVALAKARSGGLAIQATDSITAAANGHTGPLGQRCASTYSKASASVLN
jgi:hypothetical protein